MPGSVILPSIVIERTGIYNSEEYYRTTAITRLRPVQHYEIELFSKDGGSTVINNVRYPIRAGEILLCRPGMQRFSVLPFQCHFIWLDIPDGQELPADAATTRNWLTTALAAIPPVTTVESPARYIALFEAIRHNYRTSGKELLLHARITELLYSLFQDAHRGQIKPDNPSIPAQAILTAVQFIDRYYDHPISLESLADLIHLSPNYLHRLFSCKMGLTPYQYILDRRLEAARELLLNSDFSLAEIAERCAFASQSYFSFVFRRETGQTPGQYRKKQASIARMRE